MTNHSFPWGQTYSARTIYHETRPARAISKGIVLAVP